LAAGAVRAGAALDISWTFVEIARKNVADAGVPVDVSLGNASDMPFADDSFDLLVCRAAFKNFSEPRKAIDEMRRVLRPGGTGAIMDLRRDVPMTEIKRHVGNMHLGVFRVRPDSIGMEAWFEK
jgi:ubiquinone/menaquinone biosynthesis C-methylase UbiE